MLLTSPSKQKGSTIVTVMVWLITLIGFSAVAFDIGHLLIVRNELTNAADAAALAGANCLNKTPTSSGTDCISAQSSKLEWNTANSKASNSIGLNKSDNMTLTHGTVQTGYWNLNGGTILQPTHLSPIGPCNQVGGVITGACDKPAVEVTLRRDIGLNGGPVGTLIGMMFGGSPVPISATAVAVISSPGAVLPGNLIPQAINKCMFDLYWDSSTNSPKLATSTTPINGVPQTVGQPIQIRIGSSYHYGNCESGQWTSFNLNTNSASTIKNLINNGNPDPMSIGDNTWIQTGTKNSGYNELSAKYPTGGDVTLVVVDNSSGWNTNAQTPIVAFAGFHIDDVQGGSGKYIEGHFINGAMTHGSSGIGPYYGTYTPPRLAQ